MNFDFPKPNLRAVRLDTVLAEIERGDFVRRLNESDTAYSFKHVLIQETAYASLLRNERRALHRNIAISCEQLFADQLDDYLALLAFHYEEAGETAKAVSYWMRYGERAMQISAYPEAIHALEHALRLVPNNVSERARALTQLGEVYCRRTDFKLAEDYFRDALDTAIAIDEPRIAAMALTGVARVASQRGAHVQARELGIEALRWAKDSQDREAIARAHRQLGVAFNYEGVNTLAQENLQAALALFRELQDEEGVGSCLNSLGVIAREEGDVERAQALFQEAYALSKKLGDRYAMGVRLVNLGAVAEQRGEYAAAEQYQDKALAIAQEIGDREGVALSLVNLASLALTRGEHAKADALARQALCEASNLGSIALALYIVGMLAKIQAARGEFQAAAELLGLALTHPSSSADVKNDFEPLVAELEIQMTRARFDEAFARGKTLQLAQVVQTMALNAKDEA